MATNRVFELGGGHKTITMPVISGTVSGDAVATVGISGVALTDRDADGNATVCVGNAAFDLPVAAGTDDTSPLANGSAVAVGDLIYVNATTGVVSKDAGGVLLGYALETVTSGETATIRVMLRN